MQIVYWSGASGTTRRIVEPYGGVNLRDYTGGRFVIVFPSYGAPRTGGYIPPAVQRFLEHHHDQCEGVIGVGNTTFGADYCKGALIASEEYSIPLLGRIDLVPGAAETRLLTLIKEKM